MKRCTKTIHSSDGRAARKLRWILILLEIALGLTPQLLRGQPTDPKFSSCLNSCFDVCNSGPEMLRWGCREGCGRRCEEEAGPPPPPIYGAIAWGTRSAQGDFMEPRELGGGRSHGHRQLQQVRKRL